MSNRGKLLAVAKKRGITVMQLIDEAIAEHKTEFKAAVALGVYPRALRYHREKNRAIEAVTGEKTHE